MTSAAYHAEELSLRRFACMFSAGRRWLPVSKPGRVDHEGAQLALMAGFEGNTEALSDAESNRLDEMLDLDLPRAALQGGRGHAPAYRG